MSSPSMETYTGHVRTPADAIILFEACRLGLLPRVQRRLSEKERQNIKSGSVFVWDEREAGMRRWTDGKSWSASRVSGSFLTYREMEGKRGGNGFSAPLAAARAGKTPDSTRGSDSDLEMAGDDGHDGYRYKPDGLMKQSFSITTSSGNHLHLISYYARSHPNAGGLCNPSSDPQLRHIHPQKGMYPETTVHEQQSIPAVTRAPMASAPYSTVPQMAGYARSGAPQHPIYAQPGYAWTPQSPMENGHMQNGHANGYHSYEYPYSPRGPPPPPPNGYSPVSQPHPAPPTSQPQQTHSPHPHPHPYERSPGPRYDRSPAPNESVPPPPQRASQHHRVSSAGPAHQQYHPHPSERSHYPAQQQQSYPSHGYEHQQPPHYAPNQSSYPHPDHTPYRQPYQHYPPPSQQPYPHNQPRPQTQLPTRTHSQSQHASTPIDPRLMAPSGIPHHQRTHSASSRTPSPRPLHQQQSHQSEIPRTNGTSPSQASTIPSIGSIMNGPPPAAAKKDRINKTTPSGKSDRGKENEKNGSKSSSSGHKKRDAVPNEKLGNEVDNRAIQKLDRAFRT